MLEGFPLPATLLEADCVVTLPKLKTHALTYFTGALKNQWGCIPRADRILLHKHLHRLVPRLNRIFNVRLGVMDALVAMEGRGPTNGAPRRLGLILAADDPVALDGSAMRLVGLDPTRAQHWTRAVEEGVGMGAADAILLDRGRVPAVQPFLPARREWVLEVMDFLSRYRPFVYHVLLDGQLFSAGRRLTHLLRRWRLT